MLLNERQDIIKYFLDNDKSPGHYQDMGIFKYGKKLYPEMFYNEFAPLHYQIIQLIFNLYDPLRERRLDRQAAVICHREAAKTSIVTFLFPSYIIYNKGLIPTVRLMNAGWEGSDIHDYRIIQLTNFSEDYIIIASETASSSEGYVNNLRSILETRGDLAELYGEKDPRMILLDDDRLDDKTWRKSTFVTSDNTIVRGVGTGQQIRGRQELKLYRPTLLIFDDMYSEENTKSETSRHNLSKWYNNAAINSLDSVKGKSIWLGTMVHPDTVIKDFRKSNSGYLRLEKPIISKEELKDIVQLCTNNEGQLIIPSKEKAVEIQSGLKTLSWPSRHDIRYILRQYSNYKNKDQLDWFFQEYMNEYQDPEGTNVKEEQFYFTEISYWLEGNQIAIEFVYEGIKWLGRVIWHIGMDPASSSKKRSDDTAISLCGIARCFPRIPGTDYLSQEEENPNGKIFPIIMHLEGGKYAITKFESMPGMCESIMDISNIYELTKNTQCAVKIELAAEQEQILREILTYFREKNVFMNIYGIQSNNDYSKAERILNTLLPIFQRYKKVICNIKYKKLIMKAFYQLIMAGTGDKDDYIDSIYLGFKDIQVPYLFSNIKDNNKSEDDDEYESHNTRYKDMSKMVGESNAWQYL